MKIPEKFRELVALRISECGNTHHLSGLFNVNCSQLDFLFVWSHTPEGWDIWSEARVGNFKPLEDYYENR